MQDAGLYIQGTSCDRIVSYQWENLRATSQPPPARTKRMATHGCEVQVFTHARTHAGRTTVTQQLDSSRLESPSLCQIYSVYFFLAVSTLKISTLSASSDTRSKPPHYFEIVEYYTAPIFILI